MENRRYEPHHQNDTERVGRSRRCIAAWLEASGARVLLAEDDEALRALIASALREHDYRVTEVPTHGELAAAVDGPNGTSRFDLIVADVHMPGGSGMAMLETLRARGVRTPMVLTTGFAPPELRDRAIRLGATVIEKPFGVGELHFAVEQALLGRTPVHLSLPWSL